MKTKTTFLTSIIILFLFSFTIQFAWAAPPQVTNVKAEQRPGTKLVDITYDINDPDGDKMYVWVEVSADGGANYDQRARAVEGDVGADIESGKGKHILWIAGEDLPDAKGENFRVKVVADDTNTSPVVIGGDGAEMALIPAGEFQMGDNFNEGSNAERPVHTVYLDAFFIDKYEVTNAQYAKFLNAYGKNVDAAGHQLFSNSDIEKAGDIYKPKAGYENHPIVYVSWYGAAAYAQFYGKRLPTEAEWEKAARGGLVGKRYPWGDDISHDDANYDGTGGKDKWNGTSPVGSFAPNGYGLYDMAGNVWEWCADEYDSGYYSNSPKNNPKGPGAVIAFVDNDFTNVNILRVLRGGSWNNSTSYLRCAGRNDRVPTNTSRNIGFRCAQDL